MAVRIRLQRFGKKGRPFYHIVVADGRAPRDGRFIEKLGIYNPMTNPASIEIAVDKAVNWLRNGAQPSDTARSLMSRKGVMLKHHLLKGVDKGALTVEQADAKFNTWLEAKEQQTVKALSDIHESARKDAKARLAAEEKVKKAREEEMAKRLAALNEEVKTADIEVEETPAEVETAEIETTEEPAAEVAE
ncbi:MAG: 30S ribosomal protein S16 [Bacteroidales bacterium]|jgi:small subunit ribosomal protein S16|nr:30S ribosomal protein S16 [Bacteroidales bacterium]